MLVRLTTDQISRFWDIIKYSFEQAAPPIALVSPEHSANLLEDLLVGTADCWISFQRENGNKIDGVVITKVVTDEASKTRNLLIYSLFAYVMTNKKSWTEGLRSLARWAKSKRCYNIIGFTQENQIISLVNKLGGNTDTTLIMFDVDKALELGEKLWV